MFNKTKKEKLRCVSIENFSIKSVKDDEIDSFERMKERIFKSIISLGFKKITEVPIKKANCIVRISIERYQQNGSNSIYRINRAECYTKTYDGNWITGMQEETLNLEYEKDIYRKDFLQQNSNIDFSFEYYDCYLKVR